LERPGPRGRAFAYFNAQFGHGARVAGDDRRIEADMLAAKRCSAPVPIAAGHLPDGMSFDAPALPGAKCMFARAAVKRAAFGTRSVVSRCTPINKLPEESIMKNMLISLPVLLVIGGAAIVPAAAQTTTTEYYVVQDVKTKKCTIVDKRPTTTTEFSVLGNGFKTRTEAESGMKTEKICTTER
jgi:hypothetical protein